MRPKFALAPVSRTGKSEESRWPAIIAISAVFLLLVLLPGRVRVLPLWGATAVALSAVLPLVAVSFATHRAAWLRVERTAIFVFVAMVAAATLLDLVFLVTAMILRSKEVNGLTLLTSSVGVWVTNVLMFSLLYWQIDRGGPGARETGESPRPDWLFPQESAPAEDLPLNWRPTFVDYLFLAFSTATAFSTTDIMPLTHRAKVIMMIESSISLVTLVVVAARAINVLGS